MAIIDDGIYAVRDGNMYKIIVPEPQFPGAKTVKIRLRPETNAERIRSMTDEELADEILSWFNWLNAVEWDDSRILKWLKQEAVDNGACSADETSEKVQNE